MSATILRARGAVLADAPMVAGPTGSVAVQMENGRVAAVVHDPAPAELDGLLLPGPLDLQVNGMGGRDVAEASDEALDAVAAAVWEGGATAFLPTLITAPFDLLCERASAVAAWIERWRPGVGARPLGLHLEGPFLEVPGTHPAEHFVDPTPDRVRRLVEAARGRLRLLTLAPGRRGAAEATAALRAAGAAVAIGHAADAGGFPACIDAGAGLATHLFNAMSGMHHRDPGIAGIALDDRRVACSLICDGVHVHPALLRTAFRVLGPTRTILVTDAVAAAACPDGRYRLGEIEVEARGGVVRNRDGQLAGSALTMADAVRGFLAAMGDEVGPWTVAQVAAATPARAIAAGDRGVLASGRRAAVALLQPDGTVRALAVG